MTIKPNEIKLSRGGTMDVGLAQVLHGTLAQHGATHPDQLEVLFELAWDRSVSESQRVIAAELQKGDSGLFGDDGTLPPAMKQIIRASVEWRPGGGLHVSLPFKTTDNESLRKWLANREQWEGVVTESFLRRMLNDPPRDDGPGPGR